MTIDNNLQSRANDAFDRLTGAGFSLAEIGRRIDYTRIHVSRVRNGQSKPILRFVLLLESLVDSLEG